MITPDKHPFLAVQPLLMNDNKIFQLRSNPSTINNVSLTVESFVIDKSNVKKSLEDVEKTFIKACLKLRETALENPKDPDSVLIQLIRSSNEIAKHNFRGAGNVIIAPKGFELKEQLVGNKFTVTNSSIVPKNKLIIIYVGSTSMDAAAIYCPKIDNNEIISHGLFINDSLLEKYVRIVKIK